MVQTTQITLRDHIQQIEDAISAGQIDEAMADCQKILAHYPDALEIQRLLGEVYLAQGRLEEAQQTFDWILINDPENVIVYCDRALICEHQKDLDTALDCYQQAYELSRGNSQIRQEFNALSKRAGQQEFMLSRAGLARLYMRGQLLTQAVQEWEAVLVASPDRLDARLGLLETFWREGVYDEVERMSSRILEEVPQCLKALLLLAHVTSAYNMQRARDLIARAVMLDPELLMAQDLFSEIISSQPNDPFLALINREPIELSGRATNGNGKSIDAINTRQYAAVEVEDGAAGDEYAPEPVYNWGDLDSWSELDTRTVPQPPSRTPSSGAGSAEITNRGQAVPPSTFQPPAADMPVDDFDTWATQQEIDDDFDPALLEKQPWFQAEQAETTEAPASTDAPALPVDAAPAPEPEFAKEQPAASSSDDPWKTFAPKEEVPAPPAWLDKLTNFEQRQPAKAVPTESTPKVEPLPEQEQLGSPVQSAPERAVSASQSWGQTWDAPPVQELQDIAPFFFSPDDKEEDMGWPEWLKSLGAETMEPEAAAQGTEAQAPAYSDPWGEMFQAPPAARREQEPEPAQFAAWADTPQVNAQSVPETETPPSWTTQIEQPAQMIRPEQEAAYITTLETLEQSLLTQGFVPLQPGSLSAIAQGTTPPAATGPLSAAPGEGDQDAVGTAPAAQAQPGSPPVPSAQPEHTMQGGQATWGGQESQASAEPSPVSIQPEGPGTTNPPIEAAPASPGVPAAQQNAELAPAYSLDMLLDSELETTMRRPAVRLQPMQAAPSQPDQTYAPAARSVDYSTRDADSKLSNKERLVKGYQLQLAGAYDNAMQEYRTLIRNAPESLGEVISNLRALLKLAPRYTAGYRVLGDAYMRQGEYLQAMEAYNKALTIAKKAKSQGR